MCILAQVLPRSLDSICELLPVTVLKASRRRLYPLSIIYVGFLLYHTLFETLVQVLFKGVCSKKLNGFSTLPCKSRLAKLGLDRRVKSDLVTCCKILNNQVYVDADTFFTRRTVLSTLHGDIVPNYTNLVLCRFAMVISSQTVSLMLGIHYMTLFFPHVPLRGLNVDCSL